MLSILGNINYKIKIIFFLNHNNKYIKYKKTAILNNRKKNKIPNLKFILKK